MFRKLSLDEMISFLGGTAEYFENKPTEGEDRAYWSNVYNAERCRQIAEELHRLKGLEK